MEGAVPGFCGMQMFLFQSFVHPHLFVFSVLEISYVSHSFFLIAAGGEKATRELELGGLEGPNPNQNLIQ